MIIDIMQWLRGDSGLSDIYILIAVMCIGVWVASWLDQHERIDPRDED